MARSDFRLREAVRRYFVAGLLVFAPLGITIWAIAWIIQRLDNLLLPRVLNLLFPGWEPPPIPLVGAIFTLLVILLMGVLARHLFGGEFIRAWERLLARVPVARSIYYGVKQLFEAIIRSDHTRFRRVVIIEYPRKGVYALAFTTGPVLGRLKSITDKPLINIFLPTTPNPTSGFYLLLPQDEVVETNLTVEEAFKLVMSAGMVSPEHNESGAPTAAAPEEISPARAVK